MKNEQRAKMEIILVEVFDEVVSATRKFGSFNSSHEGYAVILEELDELWEVVKSKAGIDAYPGREKDLRTEAKQVAAMACRFMLDLCDE